MKQEEIQTLLREFHHLDELIDLIPVLKKMPVVEVGEALYEVDEIYLPGILDHFEPRLQGLIMAEFSYTRQLNLFKSMSRKRFALIFAHIPSEDRADLFQYLTQKEQSSLLPFLPKGVREDVMDLSRYAEQSAGGIMSTDYATISKDMTCAEAMEKIRKDAPSKRMVYYVYVLDAEQVLLGFVTLKDLILSAPSTLIETAMHTQFVSVHVEDDQEDVARKVEKYDLLAIPVLNADGQMLGIVTHDEVIDIIREEHTEDFEKFMGIVPADNEISYADTSSLRHFRKRVVWVVSLAAVGIVSGIIIHSFEATLSSLLILALYMPMVADTGGNSGSQAATVVVRALALGQISPSRWLFILWKEARVGMMLSVCLGILAYGKVLFLSWETDIPETYSLGNIALVISIALALQVITATVIGAGLPLLVKRLGGDPAVAASPAITTVVDITGLLIYFGCATLFFTL